MAMRGAVDDRRVRRYHVEGDARKDQAEFLPVSMTTV
jgi:hypothetical protein